MAKIAKSKDTANWRKGKDLAIGDLVAIAWNGTEVTATSPVISRETVNYMSVTNYRFVTESGKVVTAAGREFVEGRY